MAPAAHPTPFPEPAKAQTAAHATPIPRAWWVIAAAIVGAAVLFAIVALVASRGGGHAATAPAAQQDRDGAVESARRNLLDADLPCDERLSVIDTLKRIGDERAKHVLRDATRPGSENDCVRDQAREALDDLR
jgi:hypothetical protein